MRIQITIDGDERENALLEEIFEKGNMDVVARKWAEFQEKVSCERGKIFMEHVRSQGKEERKSEGNTEAAD